MKQKKITGIVVLVVGIGMLMASNYVKNQVEEGRAQIASGQKKVDKGNSLFSLNPVTKPFGKALTGSAQRRIDEGRVEADKYDQIAFWLMIGGIGAILVGAGSFVVGLFKK